MRSGSSFAALYNVRCPGFELSKNKWGVDICLLIVIVITHRQFSIINNGGGGGLKLTPRGIPGHLVWGGVEQTTGGVQPPTPPGNLNTAAVATNKEEQTSGIVIRVVVHLLQSQLQSMQCGLRLYTYRRVPEIHSGERGSLMQ
jgi:hypothetical protein